MAAAALAAAAADGSGDGSGAGDAGGGAAASAAASAGVEALAEELEEATLNVTRTHEKQLAADDASAAVEVKVPAGMESYLMAGKTFEDLRLCACRRRRCRRRRRIPSLTDSAQLQAA